MPNWTKNLIRFGNSNPDPLAEIKKRLAGKERLVDFNRMIPMPQSLSNAESSNTAEIGWAIMTNNHDVLSKYLSYPWVKEAGITDMERLKEFLLERHPGCLEQGRVHTDNLNRYGHATWYTWANKNWGTKWNACDIGAWQSGCKDDWEADQRGERSPDGGDPVIHWEQIVFNTAWSAPVPILTEMAKLAREFESTFDHWYSNEDGGSQWNPITGNWDTIWEHNINSGQDWVE